jgi:hypothetical protein
MYHILKYVTCTDSKVAMHYVRSAIWEGEIVKGKRTVPTVADSNGMHTSYEKFQMTYLCFIFLHGLI